MLGYKHVRIDPQVVYESFDGEILAISLESGAYYSLTGPSSQLWLLVNEGLAVGDIVDRLVAGHGASREAVAAAVHEFLARLSAERLIVGVGDVEASAPAAPSLPEPGRPPALAFEMKVFTDMQDLLLLDPIHDVEDAGWPVAREDR